MHSDQLPLLVISIPKKTSSVIQQWRIERDLPRRLQSHTPNPPRVPSLLFSHTFSPKSALVLHWCTPMRLASKWEILDPPTLVDLGACPTGPNSFVFTYIFTEKRPHRRSAPLSSNGSPPTPTWNPGSATGHCTIYTNQDKFGCTDSQGW